MAKRNTAIWAAAAGGLSMRQGSAHETEAAGYERASADAWRSAAELSIEADRRLRELHDGPMAAFTEADQAEENLTRAQNQIRIGETRALPSFETGLRHYQEVGDADKIASYTRQIADTQKVVDDYRAQLPALQAEVERLRTPQWLDRRAEALFDHAAQLQARADHLRGGLGAIIRYDQPGDVMARNLLGDHGDRNTIARLVGARAGDVVHVGAEGSFPKIKAITLKVTRPGGYMATMRIRQVKGKGLVADSIELRNIEPGAKHAGSGRELVTQLNALRSIGVRFVETGGARGLITDTAGTPHPQEYIGYKVWPKLGMQGKIPSTAYHVDVITLPDGRHDYRKNSYSVWDRVDTFVDSLPAAQRPSEPVRDVQTLYNLPGGKSFWEQNGTSFNGSFDLTKGGLTARILDRLSRSSGGGGG